MNVWTIGNDRFQVSVNALGGELCSLRDKQTGGEWLWQPQADVWNHSATQLFPVVGGLVQGGIRVNGHFLALAPHGFLRHQTFSCLSKGNNHVLLEAMATTETMKQWPWRWRIRYEVTLERERVCVSQQVFNDDDRPFWYSIGWHPGFALPIASQLGWHVEFADNPVRGPFLTRNRTLITEEQFQTTGTFPLEPSSFREGAVYFGNCQQRQIFIRNPEGNVVMSLETGTQDWLALWGVPGADLLCIEPLAGTTDCPGFKGDITHKRGIRQLKPNENEAFRVKLRFAVDA